MGSINQILPTVSYGDAVSNDAISIMKLLQGMGIKSEIFAENVHPKVKKYVNSIEKYNTKNKDDILIYHMSTGSQLSYKVRDIKLKKKVMIYHNITPSEYFKNYDNTTHTLVSLGRKQLAELKGVFRYSFGDSEYNSKELIDLGYKNVKTLPILINFEDYLKEPEKNVINKYNDGYVNILFVGRITPNKKQEDVIKAFYYYKKFINQKSRLFLVGSYTGMERYYNSLLSLVKDLQLEDVCFTGHISFEEILGYYKISDLFLCMSEHEGFCVPLIESMFFELPILAYNSSAIPDTLASSGVKFNSKNYIYIAEMINEIITNNNLKNSIIDSQKSRLNHFSKCNVEKLFKTYIDEILRE